ncbi:MAG: NAD-dependent epimerase/dehydratase family protein [Xenococcaceae cyanobacterium]
MKRIFMTGASGCIGHYIAENLIQNTEHELFLLVRNPDKLKFDYQCRPGIKIIQGDLRNIEDFSDLLQQDINVAILVATAWGGAAEAYEINVVKTLALLNLLNPDICEQVLYFSTASILDRHNELLPEAGRLGIDYIKTKYQCFSKLSTLPISDRITTLFPTLVFGGDEHKPVSHLSSGISEVTQWIGLIRWLKVDGSFHFTHAYDIAQVVGYLVDHPPSPRRDEQTGKVGNQFVLGSPAMTVDEAIQEVAAYFNQKIYFRIPLSIWLANILIKVFRIQMDSWSRFSLNYRHFVYQNCVNPASFGLRNYCSTLSDILKASGIE